MNGYPGYGPPAAPLHGGGVTLRVPSRADVDAILRYAQDPDVAESIWLPITCGASREEAEQLCGELARGWGDGGFHGPTLVVEVAEEMVGLVWLPWAPPSCEIAYGIAPKHRNHGHATAALRLATAWVLSARPDLERLELQIAPENAASRRVAEKAGYRFAGIRRSMVPATGEEFDDHVFERRREVP